MTEKKFIDIEKIIENKNPKLLKWLPGFILRYLKHILHEDQINDFLAKNKDVYNIDFCIAVMEYLEVKVEIKGLETIPKDNAVIIALNHPLGGMDAIALVAALKGHREDLKFIVNDILMNLTNLQDLFVGINKHGKLGVSTRNQVLDVFSSDQVVCVFPAGMVSRKQHGEISDNEWKKTFVTYAKRLDQPIVPIHIDGSLSKFFYRLSCFRKFIGIKANVEMIYLANELYKQKGKTITFTVGEKIYTKDFDNTKSEKVIAQEIKNMVYNLASSKK
jgi:putative hemolysin